MMRYLLFIRHPDDSILEGAVTHRLFRFGGEIEIWGRTDLVFNQGFQAVCSTSQMVASERTFFFDNPFGLM